jgi:hypothetical protein
MFVYLLKGIIYGRMLTEGTHYRNNALCMAQMFGCVYACLLRQHSSRTVNIIIRVCVCVCVCVCVHAWALLTLVNTKRNEFYGIFM